MKTAYLFFFAFIIVFSGCTSTHDSSEHPVINQTQKPEATLKDRPQELVYDLNESTSIIMSLLKNGNISEILAEEAQNSPDTIDILIKNFSPAEMAFEAEVLNFKDPVVILFYDETNSNHERIDASFKELAFRYQNKAKFVKIEVTKLFKLVEQALVNSVPTLLVINKRVEVGRVEKPDPALFDTELNSLLPKN